MSDLVPAGFYRAVAVPVTIDGHPVWGQLGRSKNKGTEQVAMYFAILDDGPYKGRRLLWVGFFTETSADRTIESLRFCGFRGDDLATVITGPLDQEVSITVEVEEYEGKKRSKVAWVNESGGGMKMANPMDAKDLRTFAAKFKAKVKGKPEIQGTKTTAPPPGAATAPAGGSDEPPEDRGDDPWMNTDPPPAALDDPF